MSRFLISIAFAASLLGVWTSSSYAQTPPPSPTAVPQDLALFGYPTVAASQTVQPDQSVTLTTGGQSVTIPVGAYSVPVRFDLLVGDNSTWQKTLEDSSDKVVATFAFRVTDISTNKLIGRASKPLQYKYTSPLVTKETGIYATSATTPPKLLALTPENNVIEGQTISRNFNGSGVGWFVTVPDESSSKESSGALTIVVAIVGGLVLLVVGIIVSRMIKKRA